MRFDSLRLTGFKSFVDPAELRLDTGLTGVVGPNGCGKSNLVEALRWVMGENSARRMRGSEMDDVIFAGTGNRPARNLAEVVLTIDNTARRAPAPYSETDTIEVSRRIERGGGSDYRINGRSVRAKDVQLLFADAATGSHSPALVSQGRVSAIVNAKPSERRIILEDAAGVAGLHARRHEAELRLKAAETNLTRVEDSLAGMDDQLKRLKKQAKQAERYRRIQEQLRTIEAALFWLDWQRLEAEENEARRAFDDAEAAVRAALTQVTARNTEQIEASSALPELRQAERGATEAVQKLSAKRERLRHERDSLSRDIQALQDRIAQIDADLAHEQTRGAECDNTLTRLAEQDAVLAAESDDSERIAALTDEVAEIRKALAAHEAEAVQLSDRIAALDAERRQHAQNRTSLQREAAAQRQQRDAIEKRRCGVTEKLAALGDPDALEAEHDAAAAWLEAAQEAAEQKRGVRESAQAALMTARERAQAATVEFDRLDAEISGLEAVLAAEAADGDGLVDRVSAATGHESGLAAALEEDLSVGDDPAAPRYWTDLGALPQASPLPEGVTPLLAHVEAPALLTRRLSQVGVAESAEQAAALAPQLAPGQALVTKAGDLWRWDGMVVRAGAPSATAIRMQQRNRLSALKPDRETAAAARERAIAARDAAADEAEMASAADKQARQDLESAKARLQKAETALKHYRQNSEALRQEAEKLDKEAARLDDQLNKTEEALSTAEAALAAMEDGSQAREALQASRAAQDRCRQDIAERERAATRLEAAAEHRRQRREQISSEIADWQRRRAESQQRQSDLAQRRADAHEKLKALADRPATLDGEVEQILSALETAEAEQKTKNDAVIAAETRLNETDRALRAAEAELGKHKEARAKAESAVTLARERQQELAQRIADQLSLRQQDLPGALRTLAQTDDAALPERAALEEKQRRLLRDRNAIGPVNLRAEMEADELGAEIATLSTERDELIAAIEKLRQAINKLNREARERVQAAFGQVNEYFSQLFNRLFAGGNAYLELTDAEDPLNAGLEIYASPPGKKLQHLSLLSGGEQALTAVALLFAMFLTNPGPICVLDEVDAPLDDANVDRFCSLLEDMVRQDQTRFLVVTHHRMTMARMQNLFGVTMVERGISQLVSVDLSSGRPASPVRGAA